MVEPAVRIRDRDGRQGRCDGVLKGLAGPRLGAAPGGLELRPARLDRRQIGRGRGQGLPPRPRRFHGLAAARGLVRPPVLPDHDGPRAPRGAEHRRHLDTEHLGIGGPVARHYRLAAVAPQGRQPGHMCPIVLRDGPDHPLAPGRPAIPAGHREVDARFSDELEARGVECGELFLRGRARLPDPLGLARIGVERGVFRGPLRARPRRPLGGTLTRRLRWAQRRSHHSAQGASGCSCTRRRPTASAASSQRARRPPAWGRGAIVPLVRRRRSRVSTTDGLTPKRVARARGEPSRGSEARRIFSGSSREEAFMRISISVGSRMCK
jgi:hypothetical protein